MAESFQRGQKRIKNSSPAVGVHENLKPIFPDSNSYQIKQLKTMVNVGTNINGIWLGYRPWSWYSGYHADTKGRNYEEFQPE